MLELEEVDTKIQKLVDVINSCDRWKTVASCEGHTNEPERGDHAFVTFELTKKDIRDYEFFHKLLLHGIQVSFGHENRVILSHPWRQYGEDPKKQEKDKYNEAFIKNATKMLTDFIRKD